MQKQPKQVIVKAIRPELVRVERGRLVPMSLVDFAKRFNETHRLPAKAGK